jgi:predicted phage tail protein
LEGAYLRPGDVFKIFDANRKNKRHGGRTVSIDNSTTRTSVVLDSSITGLRSGTTYLFSLLTPTFNYDTSQVAGLTSSDTPQIRRPQLQQVPFFGYQAQTTGGQTQIRFDAAAFGRSSDFDFQTYAKRDNLVWMIEASGVNSLDAEYLDQWDYYRAIRIEEKDDVKFKIDGIQYSDEKYQSIESGLNFETIDVVAPVPPNVDSLGLVTIPLTSNIQGIKYTLNVSNVQDVTSFLVYAKKDNWQSADFQERQSQGEAPIVTDETPDSKYLINILPTNKLSGAFIPITNGTYFFRAYSRNIQGVPSSLPSSRTSIDISNNQSIPKLLNSLSKDQLMKTRTILIASLKDEHLRFKFAKFCVASGLYGLSKTVSLLQM